jgi:hypothetical protein
MQGKSVAAKAALFCALYPPALFFNEFSNGDATEQMRAHSVTVPGAKLQMRIAMLKRMLLAAAGFALLGGAAHAQGSAAKAPDMTAPPGEYNTMPPTTPTAHHKRHAKTSTTSTTTTAAPETTATPATTKTPPPPDMKPSPPPDQIKTEPGTNVPAKEPGRPMPGEEPTPPSTQPQEPPPH